MLWVSLKSGHFCWFNHWGLRAGCVQLVRSAPWWGVSSLQLRKAGSFRGQRYSGRTLQGAHKSDEARAQAGAAVPEDTS